MQVRRLTAQLQDCCNNLQRSQDMVVRLREEIATCHFYHKLHREELCEATRLLEAEQQTAEDLRQQLAVALAGKPAQKEIDPGDGLASSLQVMIHLRPAPVGLTLNPVGFTCLAYIRHLRARTTVHQLHGLPVSSLQSLV